MPYFALVLPEACKPEEVEVKELPQKTISYAQWSKLPNFKDHDTTIGSVCFGPNLRYMALLDDNGLYAEPKLKPTININGHIICGQVAMCSSEAGGNSVGFTKEQVEKLLPVVKRYLLGHLDMETPEPFMKFIPMKDAQEFDNRNYVSRELKRLTNNNQWADL